MLRVTRKGGRETLEPLSAPVERALESYLADRTSGALFLDDHDRRMYEAQAWRLVRRLARKACLKSAGQLSPHSLRHTFATSLDDAGVPLQDIQDAMGHADPRTTRRLRACWIKPRFSASCRRQSAGLEAVCAPGATPVRYQPAARPREPASEEPAAERSAAGRWSVNRKVGEPEAGAGVWTNDPVSRASVLKSWARGSDEYHGDRLAGAS